MASPLTVKRSREWRRLVANLAGKIGPLLKINTDSPEILTEAVQALLVKFPEELVEIIVAYDPDLFRREWVEENAYEDEILAAFKTLVTLTLAPFFAAAGALRDLAPAR